MRLRNLYTDRYLQFWPSWQIVYEWEDQIASQLNLRLLNSSKAVITTEYLDRMFMSLSRRLGFGNEKILKVVDRIVSKPASLYFEMFPQTSFRFSTSKNTIPIIVDFWKTPNLDSFCKVYAHCPIVMISSMEVYQYLTELNCPLNIRFVPLSLPDKYRNSSPAGKTIDIILAGRTSPVLLAFLKKYLKKNPSIEYLYSTVTGDQIVYVSNKSGVVGNFNKREDYLGLLKKAKVAFYSTPGIDGMEDRTGGFNPVTPRLFELAISGCSIIARYPQNADAAFYRLEQYYPSADNFKIFEQQLDAALRSVPSQVAKHNEEFLQEHYTSNRVKMISEILTVQ